MIFDYLCKVVEDPESFNNHPIKTHLKEVIDLAKVFHFTAADINKHIKYSTNIVPEQITYLPFPVTYIECDSSSTFHKEDSLDPNIEYLGCGVMLMHDLKHNGRYPYFRIASMKVKAEKTHMRTCIISSGILNDKLNGNRAELIRTAIFTSYDNFTQNMLELDTAEADSADAMTTFLACLSFINTPSRFIMEESPIHSKNNGRIITRSHDRPKYTVLKPNEIKTRYGLGYQGTGEGTPKSAHPRRAHTRTLHSERFGKNQGKEVKIPAIWVGPQTCERNNKRYKVMLEA